MMWLWTAGRWKTNVVSGILLLSTMTFGIGGNIAYQSNSHAEIDAFVDSAVTEVDSSTAEPPEQYTQRPEFLQPDWELVEPFITQAVTAILKYGVAPSAHLMYSLSFVPLAVWQLISILPIGGAIFLQVRSIKEMITHG